MQKAYGTTSSYSDCIFRKDYSHAVNSTCLECKFCYRLTYKEPPVRTREASLLEKEGKISPSLFKAPITISRYCDPFWNETATKNSLTAMEYILSNGGQVILRSALMLPEEVYPLLKEYPDDIQYQPRVMSSRGTTSEMMRNQLAPGFMPSQVLTSEAKRVKSYGVDVAVYFDPYIPGLNCSDFNNMIIDCSRAGIRKIILRQLFATDKFKHWLDIRMGRDYVSNLKVAVGSYWTYDEFDLLRYIEKHVKHAKEHRVSMSLCANAGTNSLICDSNCCQFNNANAFYRGQKVIDYESAMDNKECSAT